LLLTGSTDEGAFHGAFFRFEPDFVGRRDDMNLADHGPKFALQKPAVGQLRRI